jgi:uncharacterized OB-fold protein
MATDSRFDGPGPDTHYLQALSEGRLMMQHCDECASVRFPPALVCRSCGSPRLTWRLSAGTGTVYSSTTVRDKAGDYNVSLVELEGGARMMSRVEEVAPQAVRIGQRVSARIVAGEEPFVVFTPADGVRT